MLPMNIYRNQMHLLHNFIDDQTHPNDAKQKISAAEQKANEELFAKRVMDGVHACEMFQTEPIAGEARVIREILSRIHIISLSKNAFSKPTILASMREELPLLKTEVERVAQIVQKTLLVPTEKEVKRKSEVASSESSLPKIWNSTIDNFRKLGNRPSRAELYEMIDHLLALPFTVLYFTVARCVPVHHEKELIETYQFALGLIQDHNRPLFLPDSEKEDQVLRDLKAQLKLLKLRLVFQNQHPITFNQLMKVVKKIDGGNYGEKIKGRLEEFLFSREDYLKLLLMDLVCEKSEFFTEEAIESQTYKSFWWEGVPEIFNPVIKSVKRLKNLVTLEFEGNKEKISSYVEKLILNPFDGENKLDLFIKDILEQSTPLDLTVDTYSKPESIPDREIWSVLVPQLIARPLLADLSAFSLYPRIHLLRSYLSRKMFNAATLTIETMIFNQHVQNIYFLILALEKNDLQTASRLIIQLDNESCKTFPILLSVVLGSSGVTEHVMDKRCTFLSLLQKKQLVELLEDEEANSIIQGCFNYSYRKETNSELRLRILECRLEKKYGITANAIINCFKELLSVLKFYSHYSITQSMIENYIKQDLEKSDSMKELAAVLEKIGSCIAFAEAGDFTSAYQCAEKLDDSLRDLVFIKILILQAYTTTNLKEVINRLGVGTYVCYPLIIEIWSKSRGSLEPLLAAEKLALDLNSLSPELVAIRDSSLLEIARGYKEMMMPLEAKRIIGQIKNQEFFNSIKDEFSDVVPNLSVKECWDQPYFEERWVFTLDLDLQNFL